MRDVDLLLRASLSRAAGRFRPADVTVARARFLERRRRRRITVYTRSMVAAVAGVAVVVVALTSLGAQERNPNRVARRLTVSETISVGVNPSGVAAGDGSVWVANLSSGTVSRIDAQNSSPLGTVGLGGYPDDVAVGYGRVWVAETRGIVEVVDGVTNQVSGAPIVIPNADGHLDLALGRDAVWVAAPGAGLYRVDPASRATQSVPAVANPGDVAVDDRRVWVLGSDERGAGVLAGLDASGDVEKRFGLGPPPPNASFDRDHDLAAGAGAVWISQGETGTLLRVDAGSGYVTDRLDVGGSYSAVSIDDGRVFVLSGGPTDFYGSLQELDPSTADPVGPALPVPGHPQDVVVGEGGIWVTNRSQSSVTRIEPSTTP